MTIHENLLAAIAAVEAEDEKKIDLITFKQDCGTIHCTLGLLTTLPAFQAQGLVWGYGLSTPAPSVGGVKAWGSGWLDELDKLFGTGSYGRLFEPAGGGAWDPEMYEEGWSDKRLALARLNKQLELYP